MSMTRQEQLDAVVRNYGEWDDRFKYVFMLDGRIKFTNNLEAASLPVFTKSEVEQRKAELQNKPSWDDAPKNAVCVIQSDLGDWNWMLKVENLELPVPCYEEVPQYSGFSGEVIGDWRDTLEERPEADDQPAPEEEEAFKMMEVRNGECIGGALADEGSKWNGDGLPPVGVECEVYNHDFADNAEWERCTIKYVGPFYVIYESCSCIERCANHAQNAVKFRPIKSGREKWIDKALDVEAEMPDGYQPYEFLHALYDAGLGKMPEVD